MKEYQLNDFKATESSINSKEGLKRIAPLEDKYVKRIQAAEDFDNLEVATEAAAVALMRKLQVSAGGLISTTLDIATEQDASECFGYGFDKELIREPISLGLALVSFVYGTINSILMPEALTGNEAARSYLLSTGYSPEELETEEERDTKKKGRSKTDKTVTQSEASRADEDDAIDFYR